MKRLMQDFKGWLLCRPERELFSQASSVGGSWLNKLFKLVGWVK